MGFADRRMLGQLLPSRRPTGSWPENGLRGSLCWGRVRRHRTLPQADCKVENGLFRDYEHSKRFVMRNLGLQLLISFLLIANGLGFAQQRRKVIINQDCSGPGGSNMQTLLTLIQSPQVEVLGITVVSGNQWRDGDRRPTGLIRIHPDRLAEP